MIVHFGWFLLRQRITCSLLPNCLDSLCGDCRRQSPPRLISPHPFDFAEIVRANIRFLHDRSVAVAGNLGCRRRCPIEFNRDIRPILVDHCFACHGADSASRKADLRLDKREAAVEMEAIVPGDIEASGSWSGSSRRSRNGDAAAGDQESLKPEQKELLKKWIAAGAEYQPHWSFIAAARARRCPTVKNEAWVEESDRCLRAGEAGSAGSQPAAEADRRTLARRLSLDFTGLAADPALVEAFVNDTSPDAYEKLSRQAAGVAALGRASRPATGSTPPATPTRTAFTSTTSARSGRIAIG